MKRLLAFFHHRRNTLDPAYGLDDIVHDVLLKAMDPTTPFKPCGATWPWLRTCVRYELIRQAKHRRLKAVPIDDDPSPPLSQKDPYIDFDALRQLQHVLAEAFRSLSPEERASLRRVSETHAAESLHAFPPPPHELRGILRPLPLSQMAQQFGITERAVQLRGAKAKKRLCGYVKLHYPQVSAQYVRYFSNYLGGQHD